MALQDYVNRTGVGKQFLHAGETAVHRPYREKYSRSEGMTLVLSKEAATALLESEDVRLVLHK